MKFPLIIASLILPAFLLAACKPASMPPDMQIDIHAAADTNLKRSATSISSMHKNKIPATGISLESTGSLKGAGKRTAQSPSPGVMESGSMSEESQQAGADRLVQSNSQLTRKILVLQLLQTMSAARP